MPLFDVPPEAVDKVYAASLFELAEAQGGQERLEDLLGEMQELVELTRQMPDLGEFMASRIVATDDRQKSLEQMFRGQVSDLLLNFMQILNRKERLNRLIAIVNAFDHMVQERFGRVEVDVYTPTVLGDERVAQLKQELQDALKREPVIHAYVEENMLGGIKLQVGDKLIDASLRTRLRKMREKLTDEGGTLMKTRFEQAFEGGIDE
ncbi:MAG: ATP synthase F1 subunit delta [Planctomycetota bacterium]